MHQPGPGSLRPGNLALHPAQRFRVDERPHDRRAIPRIPGPDRRLDLRD